MLLLPEHKIAFVHVPKAGGTSIRKMIARQKDLVEVVNHVDSSVHHATGPQVRRVVGRRWWLFATVRNPWARMLSLYMFMIKKHGPAKIKKAMQTPDRQKAWGVYREIIRNGFSFWLQHACDRYQLRLWGFDKPIHRVQQVEWLGDVDKVYRIEDQSQRIVRKFRAVTLNRKLRLPQLNRTQHAHYSIYYTDKARTMVAELFTDDIERFGYEFERE